MKTNSNSKTKLNRVDLLRKVREVIDAATNDPADELIALGEALSAIGTALKGVSLHDARATLRAVEAIA